MCIYIYIYIYIYIHTYLVGHGNRQDVFLMVSVVDIIQRVCLVSVAGCVMASDVAGNILIMVSVVGRFLLWFP